MGNKEICIHITVLFDIIVSFICSYQIGRCSEEYCLPKLFYRLPRWQETKTLSLWLGTSMVTLERTPMDCIVCLEVLALVLKTRKNKDTRILWYNDKLVHNVNKFSCQLFDISHLSLSHSDWQYVHLRSWAGRVVGASRSCVKRDYLEFEGM